VTTHEQSVLVWLALGCTCGPWCKCADWRAGSWKYISHWLQFQL